MKLNMKKEIRAWGVYFSTLFLAIYIHELGHCFPAWAEGIRAVPTPAKEYIMEIISADLQQQISLGGIIASMLFTVLVVVFYSIKKLRVNSAILAGALAMPGIYTLRFILVGRGHDASEFQEAQAVLGLNYSGHFIDWLFIALFFAGGLIWMIKSKPDFKIIGRLFAGTVISAIFIVVLQVVNNAIFDPIFQ